MFSKTFWTKGFKFWFIGGIGIIINFAILTFLVEIFKIDYRIAAIIAIGIAAFSNYGGNILIGNIKINDSDRTIAISQHFPREH